MHLVRTPATSRACPCPRLNSTENSIFCSTYMTRTSFDTFNNPAVSDPSFTLISKHAGYTYSRHQRVFLVAVDQNDYSDFALEWLIEVMLEDGDEIICLRIVDRENKPTNDSAISLHKTYKRNAKRLLKRIQAMNDNAENKAISIILEFAIGNVEETIQRMVCVALFRRGNEKHADWNFQISIYSPAFLTVGTRGRSLGGIQGLLPGSVSKWCMQNSPVPVVMVRDPEKRRKKMQKRLKDPTRRGYSAILDQSASVDQAEQTALVESDHEADAVAKAIGLSSRLNNWRGFRKEESEVGGTKSDGEADDSESNSDSSEIVDVPYVEGDGIESMPNFTGDDSGSKDAADAGADGNIASLAKAKNLDPLPDAEVGGEEAATVLTCDTGLNKASR